MNTYEYRDVRLAALWKPTMNSTRNYPTTTSSRQPTAFLTSPRVSGVQPADQPEHQPPGTQPAPAPLYNSPVPGGAGRLSSRNQQPGGYERQTSTWSRWKRITIWASRPYVLELVGASRQRDDADLPRCIQNFYFYQNFTARIPAPSSRDSTVRRQAMDAGVSPRLQVGRACSTGSAVSSTRTRRPSSRSTSTIPATMAFINCPQTVPSDAGGVNASTAGLGEYSVHRRDQCRRHRHSSDQAYIGDFETHVQGPRCLRRADLAPHYRPGVLTGGTRAVQADSRPGAADRSAVRRPRIRRERVVER